MVKITKEFAVNIGFKTLGHYISFSKEYQVLAAQVQEFFDSGFVESAKKSYTVIAEAGIDPVQYVMVKQPEQSLFQELRNSIPIKKADSKKAETKKPEINYDASSETSNGSVMSIEDIVCDDTTASANEQHTEKLEKENEYLSKEVASIQTAKTKLDDREVALQRKEEELAAREAIIVQKEENMKKAEAKHISLVEKLSKLDEREKDLIQREKILEQKTSYYEAIKQKHLVHCSELSRKLEQEKKCNQNLAANLSKALNGVEKLDRENKNLRKAIEYHEKTYSELEQVFKRKRIQ